MVTQPAAATMATNLHAMFTRQAFGSDLFYGAGKARHDDHSLAVYEMAGFVGAEADQAAATVVVFVLGSAIGVSAMLSLTRRLSRRGGDAEELIHDTVQRAIEVGMRSPSCAPASKKGQRSTTTERPTSFEFGLQAILDGLEEQLAARHMPTGGDR